MPNAPRRWFITGVSGGIGRELARAALERGDVVHGTLRQVAQHRDFELLAPGRAHAITLDVAEPGAVERVVAAVLVAAGRIDVVVNNAGYGLVGTVEETTLEEARALFETNLFGALRVMQAFLPALRAQRGGHFVNLSSGAGIIGLPGMPLYSASKFALEGLSEALAGEVAAFGVRVTLVEPGAVNTGFAQGSIRETRARFGDYAAITGEGAAAVRKYYGEQASEPGPTARRILMAVDSPNPPLRLVIGPDAAWGVRAKLDSVAADLAASDTTAPAR